MQFASGPLPEARCGFANERSRGLYRPYTNYNIDIVNLFGYTPMCRRLPPRERAAKLDAAISLALAGLSHSAPRKASRRP